MDFTEAERVQIWFLAKDALNPECWSPAKLFEQDQGFLALEEMLKRQLSRLSMGYGDPSEIIQSFIMGSSYDDVLTLLELLPMVPLYALDELSRQKYPRFATGMWCGDIKRFVERLYQPLNDLLESTASPARFLDNGELRREGIAITAPVSLLNLPNREALYRDIGSLLSSPEVFALGIIDVDGFKQVNDQLGHPEGDKCLAGIAQVLGAAVKGKGKVYRYGGDEFAVLLPNVVTGEASATGERIRAAIEEANLGAAVTITASIGIVGTDQCRLTDAEEIVKAADAAAYVSKRTGKNRVTVGPVA